LFSPRQGGLTANQYVSSDGKQAVLFAFLHSQQYLRPAPTISLRGLDENATYRVKPLDDKLVEKQEALSGAYLMRHGLNLHLTGDYDSTLVILERME
jgi:alpha-galactosidase